MIADEYGTCAWKGCRKPFKKYRPYQKYCSTKCREKAFKSGYTYKRKPDEDKVCKYCNRVFVTNNKKKVFCSEECRLTYYSNINHKKKGEERKCLVCGRSFISAHQYKKYCSKECYMKARKIKNK